MEYSTSLDTIVLTEVQDSDASDIAGYLGQDQEIHRNLRELPQPYTLKDALVFIQWSRELFKKYQRLINFAIREKTTGRLIGCCGFDHQDLDLGKEEVGLGYWLGRKYWGQGIGTAVVGTLVHLGLNEYGFAKLYAPVFEWNKASQKVLLKNGFVKEAFLKNYIEKHGEKINAVKLSIVKKKQKQINHDINFSPKCND